MYSEAILIEIILFYNNGNSVSNGFPKNMVNNLEKKS